MKILLLGEYSNVHWTLAEGLRTLGHQVTVVSDGDLWKNYKRDIDLSRHSLSHADTLRYYIKAWSTILRLRGYDVVQIINPIFLDLRASRIRPFYNYLRRHNRHIVMGAFGMDHYWVKTCLDCKTFRYSDFNIGPHPRTQETFNQEFMRDWLSGEKKDLNTYIAADCDAIVSGLCEYDMCYRPVFPQKTTYIPMPIVAPSEPLTNPTVSTPVRILIGIQKTRSEYKGTDIMLRALCRVKAKYPDRLEIVKVENMPFDQYCRLMRTCDVIVDQLYSYTPAMNALQAMAEGMVVVGGGEPENYEILGETELRPIVNVQPDEDDCYRQMEQLVLHPERIPQMKHDSVEYIRRHHDHIKVAQRYEEVYRRLC